MQAAVNCHETGGRNTVKLDGDQNFALQFYVSFITMSHVFLSVIDTQMFIIFAKGSTLQKNNLSFIFKMKKIVKTSKEHALDLL